jgi:cell division transport system permease protein
MIIPHSKILPRNMLGSRLLPLVIAVNVYLASLAILGGLALIGATGQWATEIEQLVTVQVPPESGVSGDAVVKSVLGVLRDHPGVAQARALELSEMEALLAPWLGQSAAIKELPLPQLIDVELRPDGDLDSLRKRLDAEFPGVEIDDHRQWREQMQSIATSARLICWSLVAMISLAAIAVIIFATRASLENQNELVALMHLIGAHNSFVAGEFQKHFLGIGVIGVLIGLVPVVLTIGAILYLTGDDPAPWMGRMALGPVDYILAALPPLTAALITMLTARLTVLRALAVLD